MSNSIEKDKIKADYIKQGYSFQEVAKITLCSGIIVYLSKHQVLNIVPFYLFITSLSLSFISSTIMIGINLPQDKKNGLMKKLTPQERQIKYEKIIKQRQLLRLGFVGALFLSNISFIAGLFFLGTVDICF
jgi:hypothetical protein